MAAKLDLPVRVGPKPDTTSRLPHSQLNQHGPDEVIEKLHHWCFSLPGVNEEESGISVPGARALVLHECAFCNHDAFMVGREFAHIHPHPDSGSMHVMLSAAEAEEVVDKGWGEDHYLVTQGHLPFGLVMVFSPRDDDELSVVKDVVGRSLAYASSAKKAL